MTQTLSAGVTVRQVGEAYVARLVGSRTPFDELTTRDVRQELFRLVDTSSRRLLLIDCGDVAVFGSGLLAVLIDLNRTLKSAGGRLALCRLSDQQREMFKATRLDHAFAIYPDEESGLRELRETGLREDAPSPVAVSLSPDCLEVVHINGIAVMRFRQAVVLHAQPAEALAARLAALAAGPEPARLVVNISNVITVGSLMIGGLLTAARAAAASGGRLVLCGANRSVENVLKLTRVVDSAPLYADEVEALESF